MSADLLTEWSRLLLGTLARAGVRDAVISPGSRSTPFTWAALHEPRLVCRAAIDERAAAFFALGQARASGRASLLICTSGSAPAHYYPAVVEAKASATPLIVLTADRPFELQDCGALQTTDQVKLYGAFAPFFELGHPDAAPSALRALARTAAQALGATRFPRPGPVHMNARARKPLEPTREGASSLRAEVDALLERGPVRIELPTLEVPHAVLDDLVMGAESARRPLVVCGALTPHEGIEQASFAALTRGLVLPHFAEATSQLRFGSRAPAGIDGLAWLLACPSFRARYQPDWLLELGAPLIARSYVDYLESLSKTGSPLRRHVASPHGFSDPVGGATTLVKAPAATLVEALKAALDRRSKLRAGAPERNGSPESAERRETLEWLVTANRAAWRVVDSCLSENPERLDEARAVRLVCQRTPPGSFLVLGNSLPIRHADLYAKAGSSRADVLFQRGTNGIDGLISGAAGAGATGDRPTTLLLGDVSFLHDVGGLELARQSRRPLVILVLDNGGGRIFDQLPLRPSELPSAVGDFWTTPRDFDFGAAACAYGARFEQPRSVAELGTVVGAAYEHPGATIVEIRVEPRGAAELAERVVSALDPEIASLPGLRT